MMAQVIRLPIVRPLPATRGECIDDQGRPRGPRPCPHATCRYNFAADFEEGNAPRHARSGDSCVLDVIDREGALTLEQIAEIYGCTRERIRQIEAKAIARVVRTAKARRFAALRDLADHEFVGTSSSASAVADEGDGTAGPQHGATEPEDDWREPSTAVWEGLWARGWDSPGSVERASERAYRAYVERLITRGIAKRTTKHDAAKSAERTAALAATEVPDMNAKAHVTAKAVEEQILASVVQGNDTPKKVVADTGLPVWKVAEAMIAMASAGTLVKTGQRRGARYSLPGKTSKADTAADPKGSVARRGGRAEGKPARDGGRGRSTPRAPGVSASSATRALAGDHARANGAVFAAIDQAVAASASNRLLVTSSALRARAAELDAIIGGIDGREDMKEVTDVLRARRQAFGEALELLEAKS